MKPFLLFLCLFLSQFAFSQRTSLAFWNVENLFDTIPSTFYNDSAFTPSGKNAWNTARYSEKISNLARVIDDLGADIVGLAEVENESVVRDLVLALRTDYSYIHRTLGDPRGIDLALLYKGDRFFPDRIELVRSGMRREFLHIRGELPRGIPIDIVVVHLASKLNSESHRKKNMQALQNFIERLKKDSPGIVVMGDMNATPADRIVSQTLSTIGNISMPHALQATQGRGSYSYRGRWYLYDWMLVSGFRVTGAGIYARDYFTETTRAGKVRPLRSFSGGKYRAGFSDHFPVWLEISK